MDENNNPYSGETVYTRPEQPTYSQPDQSTYSDIEQPTYSQPDQSNYTDIEQPTYSQPDQSSYITIDPSTYSDSSYTYTDSTYSIENTSNDDNDGFAIASLVLGILGLVFGCCICAKLFSILAIIFGCISKKNIEGKKSVLAIIGIILGAISIVFMVIIFFFSFVGEALSFLACIY